MLLLFLTENSIENLLNILKNDKDNKAKIKKLSLRNCFRNDMKRKEFINFISNWDLINCIEELDLSDNKIISDYFDKLLKILSDYCTNLRFLKLRNTNLNSLPREFLYSNVKNLKFQLDISDNDLSLNFDIPSNLSIIQSGNFTLNNLNMEKFLKTENLNFGGKASIEIADIDYENKSKFRNIFTKGKFKHVCFRSRKFEDCFVLLEDNSDIEILEFIDLSQSSKGILSYELIKMPSLKSISFNNSTLHTNSVNKILQSLPRSIKELNLSGFKFKSDLLSQYNLEKLYLSRCKLEKNIFKKFEIKNLKVLDISYSCFFKNENLAEFLTDLRKIKCLTEIYMFKTGIKFESILNLIEFTNYHKSLIIFNSKNDMQKSELLATSKKKFSLIRLLDQIDQPEFNLQCIRIIEDILRPVREKKILEISERTTPFKHLGYFLDVITKLKIFVHNLNINNIKYDEKIFIKLIDLRFSKTTPQSLMLSNLKSKEKEKPLYFFIKNLLPKLPKLWEMHINNLELSDHYSQTWFSNIKVLRLLSILPYKAKESNLFSELLKNNMKLSDINLSGNIIGKSTLESLSQLKSLRCLNFSNCEFKDTSDEVWMEIIKENYKNLNSLEFGDSNISFNTINKILDQCKKCVIEEIGLYGVNLNKSSFDSLLKIVKRTKCMKRIDIGSNSVDKKFFLEIFKNTVEINQFLLESTGLDSNLSEKLGSAIKRAEGPHVLSLSMNENLKLNGLIDLIGDDKGNVFNFKYLKEIFLRRCGLIESCKEIICKLVKTCERLELISLTDNKLEDICCKAILESMKESNIYLIDMGNVNMTSTMGDSLGNSLSFLKRLTYLNVSDNCIGDSCARHLLERIHKFCHSFEFLYIENCKLTSNLEGYLLEFLKFAPKLKTLSISGNNFSIPSIINILTTINNCCPKTFSLGLENCDLDKSIIPIMRSSLIQLSELDYLGLKGNPKLNDEFWEMIYQNHYLLKIHMDRYSGNNEKIQDLYNRNNSFNPLPTITSKPN